MDEKKCERCVYIFGAENALPATEVVPGRLKKQRHLCAEHALEWFLNQERKK